MYTTLQLVNIALRRAKNYPQITSLATNPSDAALFFLDALDLFNAELAVMSPWDHMRRQGEVIFRASLTGLALNSASASDTTINFTTDNPFASNPTEWVGAYILIREGSSILHMHRIVSVTDEDTCVITPPLFEAITSAATADIGQDGYSLPSDFWAPLGEQSVSVVNTKLSGHDPETFMRARMYDPDLRTEFLTIEQPCISTIWGYDLSTTEQEPNAMRRRLYVFPFPEEDEVATIHYFGRATALDSDDDIPSVPESYQDLLINAMLLAYFEDYDYNQAKVSMYSALVQEGIMGLHGTSGRTTDNASIVPDDDAQHWQR